MNERARLLYLTNSDWIGGMERCVINLSRALTARGWDVRSVFLDTPRSPALLSWARDQGVVAESSPDLLSYFQPHTLGKMLSLRRLVARSRPDLVHLHFGSNFVSLKDVIAVKMAGTICVASIHSAEAWHAGNEKERRRTRFAAMLCDALIAHSDATRAVLLGAGVPAHKIHRAPLGLYPPRRRMSPDQARRRLGLSATAFVITTNARLVTHKGVADLIEAVARLPDPDATVVLLVAGEGPQRAEFEALGHRVMPGRVHFLGHVADHTDLYAATSVFAMPTHDARESFGMVFIEAAFHGVPSVGTRVGGISEAIIDGRTGLLVEPHAPAELSAALERLRSNPALRQRLGQAAHARAVSGSSVAAMTDRYEEIYGQVARGRLSGRRSPERDPEKRRGVASR